MPKIPLEKSRERADRKIVKSKKRKTVLPIKPGVDYNELLRKQEVSASPALKKHKEIITCLLYTSDAADE